MKAKFIGWQLDFHGNQMFPLFNVLDRKSEYYRSTVSINRLRAEGYNVDDILWVDRPWAPGDAESIGRRTENDARREVVRDLTSQN